DFLTKYFAWTAVFLSFIFLTFGLLVSRFKTSLSQPNVVVGALLFFVSIVSISRAGLLGDVAWEGMSELITPAGSFIVLLGSLVIVLIILFNTSLDQVWKVLLGLYRQYIVRPDITKKKVGTFRGMAASPLKVLGGAGSEPVVNKGESKEVS